MATDARQGNDFYINLFGTIAGNSSLGRLPGDISFIPAGSQGEILQLKGESARWLGLRVPIQQMYAYDYCFPLASVIDRLAEADITGQLSIVYPDGKGKDNTAKNDWAKRMTKLLARPNPLQSWEQFRGQQVVFKKIFGFCPVLPFVPSGFEYDPSYATSMINLPPWLFTAIPTYKIVGQSDIGQIVKEYRCSILGEDLTFQPDQVLILEDSFINDIRQSYLLPQSRLVGLDMAVSNICAAMEADNVLLRKKGPLGFLSHDAAATKDATAGYIPMSQKEKDELQSSLQNYGMSWAQYQYVISRTATKWNPMSFDVKQLGTKETVLAGARAVCQRFGFPYVLFEDSDATYSNQESAHKKLYDNNIIPNNLRDMSKLNIYFKGLENNGKVTMDYSHLSVFQEDALNEGRASAYLNQGQQILYLNDVITLNEWREAVALDKLPSEQGDKYYSQGNLKASQDEIALKQTATKSAVDNLNQNQPPAK